MKVNAATACYPGVAHEVAVSQLLRGAAEPALGVLATEHIQLCPQNSGAIDDSLIESIKFIAPDTQFRLHANVRLPINGQPRWDASNYSKSTKAYFTELAEVSKKLKAPAYTLHAGNRKNATLASLKDTQKSLQDMFEVPVGIEGLYPTIRDEYLVSTWQEYRWLMDSNIPYALDLSHLAIVVKRSGHTEDSLLLDLMTSDLCLEIHLSDNDGRSDSHEVLRGEPWWWKSLTEARAINDSPVLFSEGNQLKGMPMRDRAALN